MALTPLDIHHKEFKTARFGGYNEEEVDSFLDQVADEFERLHQEGNELRIQMDQLRKRLSEFEEMQTSLQSALLAATKSAEAVVEQARQEAEAMLFKAREEADSLVRSAQEQARQMTMRAENERQKLERSFSKLKDIKRRYLQSIRDIADSHLAQVAELEAKEAAEARADELPLEMEATTAQSNAQPQPMLDERDMPTITVEPELPPARAPAYSPQPPPFVEQAPTAPKHKATPTPVGEAPAPKVRKPRAQSQQPSPASPQVQEAAVPVAPAPETLAAQAPAPAPPAPEIPHPPNVEQVAAPPLEAPAQRPVQRVEEAPAAPQTRVEEPAPVRAPDAEAVSAQAQPASSAGGNIADKVLAPPTGNLVEEVLSTGDEDDIFGQLDEDDQEQARDKGRKGRKDKKEKHFFWE